MCKDRVRAGDKVHSQACGCSAGVGFDGDDVVALFDGDEGSLVLLLSGLSAGFAAAGRLLGSGFGVGSSLLGGREELRGVLLSAAISASRSAILWSRTSTNARTAGGHLCGQFVGISNLAGMRKVSQIFQFRNRPIPGCERLLLQRAA